MKVPDNKGVLVVSYIGYLTQEVPFPGTDALRITLAEDAKALGEVVVIGYGTQRSQDVTGSVSTINPKALKHLPVATIDQKMVDQVAGVQIQQMSGAPGGGTSAGEAAQPLPGTQGPGAIERSDRDRF